MKKILILLSILASTTAAHAGQSVNCFYSSGPNIYMNVAEVEYREGHAVKGIWLSSKTNTTYEERIYLGSCQHSQGSYLCSSEMLSGQARVIFNGKKLSFVNSNQTLTKYVCR